MKVISTENKPIFMWLENVEDSAMEQIKKIANLPFTFKQVAIMPDCHTGYGMPIGGVLATNGVVIPNAVGVDIGCGMCAVKTDIQNINQEQIKEIMKIIRQGVPVGFNRHKEDQDLGRLNDYPAIKVIENEIKSAKRQIGTLGGGNHFIEIQKGNDGYIWFMIHSGSRNFGYKIAKEYNQIAQKENKQWWSSIPEPKGEDGLAFLPINHPLGNEYITAMNFALDFAKANRSRMATSISEAFRVVVDCGFDTPLDVHHNYARIENHFGHNVVVHRKGATSAKVGELGIIPGSQGTKSYIVEGKGEPNSFMSCSHGAGRAMSRTRARNELDFEEEKKILDDQNIIHSIRNKKDLDEASSSYKNIDVVMANQIDLVNIKVELTPLAVIKG